MADVKISALPAATSVADADLIPIVQGGTTKQATRSLVVVPVLTPTAVKTTNYSAAAGDFVPVDTTAGNVTVTFPTAPADKTLIGIKHVVRGGTNTVGLTLGGSDVFNVAGGSASGTLTLLNHASVFQYKASTAIWYAVSVDLPYTQLLANAQTWGGVQTFTTPVLGTPTSGNLANCTALPESGVTNLTTDLAAKAPLASPTFTGTVTLPSGQALIAPALGTPASGSLADSLTYTHSLTAVPNQTGGWTELFVTGSDFTTSADALLHDITGLVSGTLTNSGRYEFQATLLLQNPNADANGLKIGIHGAGTGTAATVNSIIVLNGASATAGNAVALNAVDTATAAFLTYNTSTGIFWITGFFTATSTGTATFSLQLARVTTSAKCLIGSVCRIRLAHT